MNLQPGDALQNRYTIKHKLGEGGMGTVYVAADNRLNIDVAIKELSPQSSTDLAEWAGLRAQFRQEAVVLAKLNHPNLVKVSDHFDIGSSSYLVMSLAEGETLEEIIHEHGACSERQVIAWATALLGALDHCHQNDVIHRDIKPANIIIRVDGSPLLIDFGLVKQWDEANPHTQRMIQGLGTPEYAPPEQYGSQQGHTDSRSDLYSLGATLYHALRGEAPLSVTERIATPDRFVPLQTAVPHLSPHLAAIIMQALELAADDRFETAQAMLAALTAEAKSTAAGRGRSIMLFVGLLALVGAVFWGFSAIIEASNKPPIVVTFGSPTNEPTPTDTPTATATLLATATATLTATPLPTETIVPTETAVLPTGRSSRVTPHHIAFLRGRIGLASPTLLQVGNLVGMMIFST
ncbi:MAG: serine/threonine-protein kinase [Chloroflexota bacterium]